MSCEVGKISSFLVNYPLYCYVVTFLISSDWLEISEQLCQLLWGFCLLNKLTPILCLSVCGCLFSGRVVSEDNR